MKTNLLFVVCASILFLYPASIILITNVTGDLSTSRLVTIPLRLVVLGALLALLGISKIKLNRIAIWVLLIFSLLYFVRIFIEVATNAPETYQSPIEFILYYFSFFLFPALVLSSIDSHDIEWDKLLRDLLYISWLFLIPVLFFYGLFLGKIQRSEEVIQFGGVWVNPLMLSYSAAFVVVFLLSNRRINSKYRIGIAHCALIFLAALVPLILGSSRGSMLGLLGVLVVYSISSGGFAKKVISISIFLCFLVLLLAVSSFFELGPLFRLVETLSGESSEGQNARLVRWSQGFQQFSQSPVFGDALVLHASNNYPHNIFVEILISTGVFGMLVFLSLVGLKFRDLVRVLRFENRFWVVSLAILAFFSANFSGNITNQAGLGLSFGLITLASGGRRASIDCATQRS
jgi:O-antigen ligase